MLRILFLLLISCSAYGQCEIEPKSTVAKQTMVQTYSAKPVGKQTTSCWYIQLGVYTIKPTILPKNTFVVVILGQPTTYRVLCKTIFKTREQAVKYSKRYLTDCHKAFIVTTDEHSE